jgi:hypothetical protein
MAFHAYFSPDAKRLVKLSNNDSLMDIMDKIYVGFNNFIKKEITEIQFNQCFQELQTAYLDDNNNIVYKDNIFDQVDSSTDIHKFNRLKQSYKIRQGYEIKAIEEFFAAGNNNADWQIYLNKLKKVNFEEDSIYPLTQGYMVYILSLTDMPKLNIYTLY